MDVSIERMGRGHVVSITVSWKLQPGELKAVRSNGEDRERLVELLAEMSRSEIAQKLPERLRAAKVGA